MKEQKKIKKPMFPKLREEFHDSSWVPILLAVIAFLVLVLWTAPLLGNDSTLTKLEYSGVANFRNAKEDTVFDWYNKHEIRAQFDSVYDFYGMCNRERENGTYYWSYQIMFQAKYFKLDRFFDTEKDIDYLSGSIFYPVYEWLKIGYDFSYISEQENHSIYINLKYKEWFYSEVVFLEEILRYKIELNPKLKVKDWFFLGLKSDILFVEEKYKWNVGPNLVLKIK
jgi:hypothetical protein